MTGELCGSGERNEKKWALECEASECAQFLAASYRSLEASLRPHGVGEQLSDGAVGGRGAASWHESGFGASGARHTCDPPRQAPSELVCAGGGRMARLVRLGTRSSRPALTQSRSESQAKIWVRFPISVCSDVCLTSCDWDSNPDLLLVPEQRRTCALAPRPLLHTWPTPVSY